MWSMWSMVDGRWSMPVGRCVDARGSMSWCVLNLIRHGPHKNPFNYVSIVYVEAQLERTAISYYLVPIDWNDGSMNCNLEKENTAHKT